MENPDLHARLLEDVRRYDPGAHTRSLLDPYRDVILLQRAKFMSYDQIAATFTRHGIKVSCPGVGAYCRRTFSKAEIVRTRRALQAGTMPGFLSIPAVPAAIEPPLAPATRAPASGASAPRPGSVTSGRRGPKIARDTY